MQNFTHVKLSGNAIGKSMHQHPPTVRLLGDTASYMNSGAALIIFNKGLSVRPSL